METVTLKSLRDYLIKSWTRDDAIFTWNMNMLISGESKISLFIEMIEQAVSMLKRERLWKFTSVFANLKALYVSMHFGSDKV